MRTLPALAMKTRTSIGAWTWLAAAAMLLAAFAGPAASQSDAAAGRFIAVTGDVRILGTDGVARKAARDEVIRQLWEGEPRIAVAASGEHGIYLNPMTLSDEEANTVAERLNNILKRA